MELCVLRCSVNRPGMAPTPQFNRVTLRSATVPLTKAPKRFRVGLECDHSRIRKQTSVKGDRRTEIGADIEYQRIPPSDALAQDDSFGSRFSRN